MANGEFCAKIQTKVMKYDLVVVVDPSLEAKTTGEKLATLLEKEGFNVLENNLWGKKALAYPLKKKNEGLYFHYVIVSDRVKPKSLYDKFRLDDTILRSLVLKKEEKKTRIKTDKKQKQVRTDLFVSV